MSRRRATTRRWPTGSFLSFLKEVFEFRGFSGVAMPIECVASEAAGRKKRRNRRERKEGKEKKGKKRRRKTENSRWPSAPPPASPRPPAGPGSGRPAPRSGAPKGACPASRGQGASLFFVFLKWEEWLKKWSGLRKKKKEKKKRSRKRGGIQKTKSIFLPLPKRNPPSSLTSFELMQRPVGQGRAELHAC